MKTQKTIKLVFIMLGMVCTTCTVAFAAEVSWIPGEVGPADWSIEPANPTISDVIYFSGPTEVFPNYCVAEMNMGGTTTLTVEPETKTIYIWFQPPPPEYCPYWWNPVCGLEGSFGPLEPGQWVFFSYWFEFSIPFQVVGTYHVDDDAPGDPGPGDPNVSDPLENGTQAHPFDTIQKGIDTAEDGDTVIVQPGTYVENINFLGKNITLRSTEPTNSDVVKSTIIVGSVLFSGTEDANCMLTGFSIRDLENGAIYGNHTQATISYCVLSGNGPCGATVIENCDGTISNCVITDNVTIYECGVYPVVFGCHGLIKNCTIANNISGVCVLAGGTTTIEDSIIYNNGDPNGSDPQIIVGSGGTVNISYCDVQGGLEGISGGGTVNWGLGNIDTDPCFVQLGYWQQEPFELIEGDYHLKSEGWRWDVGFTPPRWGYDYVTSRCIDAGNPGCSLGDELMTVPPDPDNEWGVNLRINMGAYGGMAEASMAPHGWALLADLTNDGIVSYLDLAGQMEDWLISEDEQPGDLNRDGVVNGIDFAMLGEDWLTALPWAE